MLINLQRQNHNVDLFHQIAINQLQCLSVFSCKSLLIRNKFFNFVFTFLKKKRKLIKATLPLLSLILSLCCKLHYHPYCKPEEIRKYHLNHFVALEGKSVPFPLQKEEYSFFTNLLL